MNAPITGPKTLPIRAIWIGPPEAKTMSRVRENYAHVGIEIEHRGYIDGIGKIPKGFQVALYVGDAVRGTLLRKVKDLALEAGIPLVPVTGNAKLAREALREMGIKPPTEPTPPPSSALRVPLAEAARNTPIEPPKTTEHTMIKPPVVTTPLPLPSFVIANDLGPKRGRMIERKYRTLRMVIEVLESGPVWLEEMRTVLHEANVEDGRDLKSLTIDMLHWLRDAGMAEAIESGSTDAGGHTYRWSLTKAAHDDAAIAKELARRAHEGSEKQRSAARARGATQPIPPEERDASTVSNVAPEIRDNAPSKPWRIVYDVKLDTWCDPKGRKAAKR